MTEPEPKPFHRRTIDEPCKRCSAQPGKLCKDQRTPLNRTTKNLHRYRP